MNKLILLLILPFLYVSLYSQEAKIGNETKVVLLGTGTPNPDPERAGPALAIVVNGSSYVVDCDPAV